MKTSTFGHILVLATLAVSLPGFATEGNDRISEIRRHSVLKDSNGKVYFEVTNIERSSEKKEHTVNLVTDREFGKVLLERESSYSERLVAYRITDTKRQTFIEVRFKTPFTSKTRSETLREAREHPGLLDTPATIVISTNGGEWAGLHSGKEEWGELRDLRQKVRATMSFSLLEAIERMRGSVFATSIGDSFYSIVAKFAVYDTTEEGTSPLILSPAAPNCDFDKSFGYPCSEKQVARIKASAKEGKLPKWY